MHDTEGGGGNYLCMPDEPEYSDLLTYQQGSQGYSDTRLWNRLQTPSRRFTSQSQRPMRRVHRLRSYSSCDDPSSGYLSNRMDEGILRLPHVPEPRGDIYTSERATYDV